MSEVLVRTHPDPVLPSGGGPELAFSVRGADAIEADVRAAIRNQLMTTTTTTTSNDAATASNTAALTTAAAAGVVSSAADEDTTAAATSEKLSSSFSDQKEGGEVRVSTVHRVIVHYAGLDPIVEVLLGVGHHPYLGTTGARKQEQEGQGREQGGGGGYGSNAARGSTTLEELEALGAAAKAAAESVPDVARAQV